MLLRGKSTVPRGGKRRHQQRLATAPRHGRAPLGTSALGMSLAGEGKTHQRWVAGEVRENRCQGGSVRSRSRSRSRSRRGKKQKRMAVGGAFWCGSLGLPGPVQSQNRLADSLGSRASQGSPNRPPFPWPSELCGFPSQ